MVVAPLLGLAVALTGGCAVVRPPVQTVSTGWPDPKPDARRSAEAAQASASAQRSASAPRVSDSAPATREASPTPSNERTGGITTHAPGSTATPAGPFVARAGVRVPLPEGYRDQLATQKATTPGSQGRVVALLTDPAAHSISVETLPTTAPSINGYVDAYVAELGAQGKLEVASRSIKTVAGQAGIRLLLRTRASGAESVVYVTMKEPGVVLRIDSLLGAPEQAATVEWVAVNTQL